MELLLSDLRIQKYLSQIGFCSRRDAEQLIQDRKVKVNKSVVTDLGTKIDPSSDRVEVNGRSVSSDPAPRVYWMLHKPDRILTAAKPQDGKACLFDIPKLRKIKFNLSPVGRLDYRTEGLLILSNDGELVFRLSHPKFKVPRHYHALVNLKLTKDQEREVTKGLTLKDGPVNKVKLKYLGSEKLGKTSGYWYMITVHEGRNRLVRRIFEYFDSKVVRLIRTGFGDVDLDSSLKPGEYRQLTKSELTYLRESVDLGERRETSINEKRQS